MAGADPKSLASATKQAARTGVAQPVTDSAGRIVYYVDGSGAVVPASLAQDQQARADTSRPIPRDATLGDPQGHAAATANRQKQQALVDATSGQAMAAAQHPVWVNGQLMQAVQQPDGSWVTKFVGSKAGNVPDELTTYDSNKGAVAASAPTNTPAGLPSNTAFGALDVGANYGILAGISGADQFTMSTGPTDVFTGMSPSDMGAAITGKGDASPAYRPATGDHSLAANTVNDGASKMTIAQGVDWFANLSHSNQPAYNELVNMLKHAGYYGSTPGDTTAGPYGEQAGLAFVKMAKDLSVYQQTTGDQMDMATFLAQKKAATEQQAAQQTQKVFRDYTDQGTLLAAAKSAAQDAIGRNLTPAELSAFESSFRGQENTYFNQEDAAAVAQAQAKAIGESAPTFSGTRPDASGQAEGLVQGGQFTQQRADYAAQNYTQALLSLFGVK